MQGKRAQGAMEYLMTYGWAILIIAVVLGALYQLGVFNPSNFQGRAQPGSCQVLRGNGPNTTQFLSLQGTCNGQLPQFVASFNGISPNVTAVTSQVSQSAGTYATFSLWEYTPSTWVGGQTLFSFYSVAGNSYSLMVNSNNLGCVAYHRTGGGENYGASGTASGLVGKWNFIVGEVYNGQETGNDLIYINGVQQPMSFCSGTSQTSFTGNGIYVGMYIPGTPTSFNGLISNVQVYNTSLSANEIQAMYVSGIGGAPIRLQNLVGWWPLNGNANDYSGNLDNGVSTNIVYSGTWKK